MFPGLCPWRREVCRHGNGKQEGTARCLPLTGKIKKGGLVEIPMGAKVGDVIYGIGGGIKEDKAFKAVQMGGPSGGCVPAQLIDTVIDYKCLAATGAMKGSGGMVVMDETTCMVDMAYGFSWTSHVKRAVVNVWPAVSGLSVCWRS